MSRIHDLTCRIDVMLIVALWSKGRADWSWKLYWKYKLFHAQLFKVLIWKFNIFVNSCNILQILRHFLGCICVILCQIFTVHIEESEKYCIVMMSGDMCRWDLRLFLVEILFTKLLKYTNNRVHMDVTSINHCAMFIHRIVTILYYILHEFWFTTCALQWFSIFVGF